MLVIDNSEDSGTFAFKEIKIAALNFLNSLQPGESVAVSASAARLPGK